MNTQYLPLAEFALVEAILEQRRPFRAETETEKLDRMNQAINDALFASDLHETMVAFADVDAEWWKQSDEV